MLVAGSIQTSAATTATTDPLAFSQLLPRKRKLGLSFQHLLISSLIVIGCNLKKMAAQYGYHPSGIYPPLAQPSQDDALLSSMSAMSLEGSTLPPSGAPAQLRQEQSQYPGSTRAQSVPSGAPWSPPLPYGSSNSPSSNIPHMHEPLYSAPTVGNTVGYQTSSQPQVGQQHAPSTDMKWGTTDTHTQFTSPAQPVSNNYSISASSPATAYAPSPQNAYKPSVAGHSPAQYQLPYQQPQNAPWDYQQPPGTTSISSGFPNAQSYYGVPASQQYSQPPPAQAIASGSSNTYIAHQGYQDQQYGSYQLSRVIVPAN